MLWNRTIRSCCLGALGVCATTAVSQDADFTRSARPSEVQIEHQHPAGHTLGATIRFPDEDKFGPGPYPAVVLISGSGQQDRDSTIFGHHPFALIARSLADKGVASVRFDDRGIGKSTGDFAQATTYDFASDAAELVHVAATRDDIDAGRVGVLGHSEGGLAAMMLAAGNADVPEPGADPAAVSFLVLLASPGVDARELMALQATELIKDRVRDQEAYAKIPDLHRAYTAAVVAQAPIEEIEDAAVELAFAQMTALGVASVTDQQTKGIRSSQQDVISRPWLRTFLSLDPTSWFESIDQPALVASGELDLQVIPDQNVPPIVDGLKAGGNQDVTVLRFERLNHLFQPARTGAATEYAQISTTFDPDALEQITQWIAERAGAVEAED